MDCYTCDSTIQADRDALGLKLRQWDLDNGNTSCTICVRRLVDADGNTLLKCERDHCHVATKTQSVGMLIMTGAPWSEVRAEAEKCRVLCIRCHSLVTFGERSTGLWFLARCPKAPELSVEIQQLEAQVETIVRQVLSVDTEEKKTS